MAGQPTTSLFIVNICSHILNIPHHCLTLPFFFFSSYVPVSPTWRIAHRDALFLLQFLNLKQSVGLLGQGISPSPNRYLTQKTE
jgi:hypothetical protein